MSNSPILKSKSILWKKAVKYSRRKNVNSKPIALSIDGLKVKMVSLIRGNNWEYTEKQIDLLLKK